MATFKNFTRPAAWGTRNYERTSGFFKPCVQWLKSQQLFCYINYHFQWYFWQLKWTWDINTKKYAIHKHWCFSSQPSVRRPRLFMPPTSKKLMGAYWFGVVRSSRIVHARVLKFHIIMDSPWNNSWHTFFLSCPTPFLEVCPFEKIRIKSDACHILWIVRARVLKFHTWIPHGKK